MIEGSGEGVNLKKNAHGHEKIIGKLMNIKKPLPLPARNFTELEARDILAWTTRKINKTPIVKDLFKEQRIRRHEAEEASLTDTLTGLRNRTYLLGDDRNVGELEQEFNRAIRFGNDLAILVIDLDHFKDINDKYSHAAGDEFLKILADSMRKSFRHSDVIARYGGEEFVAILPELKKREVKALMKRFHKNYKKLQIESGLLNKYFVSKPNTLSIGIAFLKDDNGKSRYGKGDEKKYRDYFNEADKAMYNAKRLGRNRTVVFKP